MPKHAYFLLLFILVLLSFFTAVFYGAVPITFHDMYEALSNAGAPLNMSQKIFLSIRLPRALMCLVCGAVLGLGGSLLQAMFRNPLLDPGLIGTSSGAAFGASLFLVLGAHISATLSFWLLPVTAATGGLIATTIVLMFAGFGKGTSSSPLVLLLTGIAINAIFLSGVGFLTYLARDPQARSITFWNLGTFSGSSWTSLGITTCVFAVSVLFVRKAAKALNAMAMGTEEAVYLGINVRAMEWRILICNTIMVSVATAFTGVIAFAGLVVPHIVRITLGSDNRLLLPASALVGGIMITFSDVVSRIVLQPTELPIGIVTSLVGVPVFLVLIRTHKYYFG